MNSYLLFTLALSFISWATAAPTNLDSGNNSGTDGDDPFGDDRINLNVGNSRANAVGGQGGYSGINANSWGVTAGLKNQNTGRYNSFANLGGGVNNRYSSGYGAPQTWASSNSRPSQYQNSAYGTGTAGIYGGRGTPQISNKSQAQSINLGGGRVLYSNLKTKKTENDGSQSESIS